MKLLEIPVTVSERIEYLLQRVVADVRWLDGAQLADSDRQSWQRVIDQQLQEWQRDPSQLEDEGVEPPSLEVLPLVVEVAAALRDHGVEPPLRVLPNGEGGVVFEWRDTPYFWSLEVEQTGSLNLSIFRNSRLISRHQLA